MEKALCNGRRQRVDVRLMMPGIPDHKFAFMVAESYFGELLDHGVKIYRFTPGLLHGKTVLADREAAFVGSVNMDYRSFQLALRVSGTLLYGAPALETLRGGYGRHHGKVLAGDSVRTGSTAPAAPGAGGPAAALRHVDVILSKKRQAAFSRRLHRASCLTGRRSRPLRHALLCKGFLRRTRRRKTDHMICRLRAANAARLLQQTQKRPYSSEYGLFLCFMAPACAGGGR
ncbi:MAG: phospholipase D-like domain-containing protein [Oscillospiraceae bacterium]